eukprot:TRINITY_DN5387_c0_g2_i2.p2 TRINITY_DN5387_c0_g2~~TRINITY_DN5387_c0_g2_i2.p2  ORF type:complete len:214 (-),score=-22.08 TRINITY_DN5387_c0_g2_i2:485-1126(-)
MIDIEHILYICIKIQTNIHIYIYTQRGSDVFYKYNNKYKQINQLINKQLNMYVFQTIYNNIIIKVQKCIYISLLLKHFQLNQKCDSQYILTFNIYIFKCITIQTNSCIHVYKYIKQYQNIYMYIIKNYIQNISNIYQLIYQHNVQMYEYTRVFFPISSVYTYVKKVRLDVSYKPKYMYEIICLIKFSNLDIINQGNAKNLKLGKIVLQLINYS